MKTSEIKNKMFRSYMALIQSIWLSVQNVKLINILLVILTGSITIAAIIGVIAGKTHHVATAFMAAFITLLLIADAKKATK